MGAASIAARLGRSGVNAGRKHYHKASNGVDAHAFSMAIGCRLSALHRPTAYS
jgi:hypothetical protein